MPTAGPPGPPSRNNPAAAGANAGIHHLYAIDVASHHVHAIIQNGEGTLAPAGAFRNLPLTVAGTAVYKTWIGWDLHSLAGSQVVSKWRRRVAFDRDEERRQACRPNP